MGIAADVREARRQDSPEAADPTAARIVIVGLTSLLVNFRAVIAGGADGAAEALTVKSRATTVTLAALTPVARAVELSRRSSISRMSVDRYKGMPLQRPTQVTNARQSNSQC